MGNMKVNSKFWLWYHLGMLLFSIAIAALIHSLEDSSVGILAIVNTMLVIFFTSTFIGYLAVFMTLRAEKYNPEQLRKRMLPSLLLFYAGAFCIANGVLILSAFVRFLLTGNDLSGFIPFLIRVELNNANFSFAVWLIFFTIAFFYVLWQKASKREQHLAEENLKYRYNTLKSQVNPHFLFNSLNTLSELVYENAKRADHYIQKLSEIYRYILENEEQDLVPLEAELEFVRKYVELQKERNHDKLQVTINIYSDKSLAIVPVSLQMLAENALKHNSMSLELPLLIRIEMDNGYIVVANNKQKKDTIRNTTQRGLANLSERIKLITGQCLVIEESRDSFVVKVPLIENVS
jgi:hypothetical protein